MPLFPNILDPNVYNSILRPIQTQPGTTAPSSPQPSSPQNPLQQYVYEAPHQLKNILTRLLSPNTYAYSPPSPTSPTAAHPATVGTKMAHVHVKIIVDDDCVLLEDEEEDGAPLCREKDIEAWKSKAEVQRSTLH